MSTVSGEEVETRWGLHPRFRNDLTPSELQQLTKLLNRVAKILGERYAAVAFSESGPRGIRQDTPDRNLYRLHGLHRFAQF